MSSTNWDKCLLCQSDKNESLRATDDGLLTLAQNLPRFHQYNALGFNIERLLPDSTCISDLKKIFDENNAKYHNKCSSNYSNSKFEKRVLEPRKRKLEKSSNDTTEDSTKVSTRNSLQTHQEKDIRCCWCLEPDDADNMHAAGSRFAKRKKANIEHVTEITEKWKKIALEINHKDMIKSLSSGDVASNELFYHKVCLTRILYQYHSSLALSYNRCEDKELIWSKEASLNKVIMYLNDIELSAPGKVHKVSELEQMYIEHLKMAYDIEITSHTTRFVEDLLKRVHQLRKTIQHGKVYVFFDSAFSQLSDQEKDPESFFESLLKVVGPIRMAMRNKCKNNNPINGVSYAKQLESVPIELLTLINFIQDGVDISYKGFSRESLALSQTIMFNFRYNKERKSANTPCRRHEKSKETPFPLYVAIKLYSTTRSKTLINWLYFSAGISISYSRLLDLTKDIANRMLYQYNKDGVFLPRVLKKKLFTIIAKDNIDQNAKSTTATKHYHGTSMSVFQFTSNSTGEDILFDEINTTFSSSKKVDELPSSYTCIKYFLSPIKDLFINSKEDVSNQCNDVIREVAVDEEFEWLNAAFTEKDQWTPWAKHHSSKYRSVVRTNDISAILPLIDKPVHTLDMQYHCMEIIKRTISILNPLQVAVDVCDEPIFALTKEIQWRFPESFGADRYFCLFGSLHIEKSILLLNGILIKGSGIDKVISSCGLSIVGTNSLVNVHDIKQARYCLQVTLCALYSLLKAAHKNNGTFESPIVWLKQRCKESQMCYFLDLVMDLMINILVFVRSIREGNFNLYISSLRYLMKWYFALDRFNYARWLTVHLYDLFLIKRSSTPLYKEFEKGFFTFQKTQSQFSLMGLDQIHEQNNAVIKGMGGATKLLNVDDDSALARWELCLHELAILVSDYEGTENSTPKAKAHHENNDTFAERFSIDVDKLLSAIAKNPFEINELKIINDESSSFNDSVFDDITKLTSEGERQFERFWTDRLVKKKVSIKEPISLNSFNLPGNQNECAKNDPIVTSLVISKLRDAAVHRRTDVEVAFETEIYGISQSLSKDRFSLYHGTKSHIINNFTPCPSPPISKNKSGIVIELSALLRKKQESWVKTFYDFACFLYKKIMDFSKSFDRIDIISDQYFSGSLKEGLRSTRGSGITFLFSGDTKLPSNFESEFLSNSINKTSLNEYLAKTFLDLHKDNSKTICLTFRDSVISNHISVLAEPKIAKCVCEEADGRIIRHVINMGCQGYQNVHIKTVDSDVVILAISYSNVTCQVGVKELYVHYGVSAKEKHFNIFEISKELGDDICKGLPFFHALSGCDTTSSFYKIGKKKFWSEWMKIDREDPSLTTIFKRLSDQPKKLDENTKCVLFKFIHQVYNLNNKHSITKQRINQLVKTPGINVRSLVPSKAGLLQHFKRCCIQAGYLWKLCEFDINIPDPQNWGWKLNNRVFSPLWQEEEIYDIDKLLKICSCKKGTCKNCSCFKSGLKCLTFCKCERDKCTNC